MHNSTPCANISAKAGRWLTGADTGLSSIALCTYMLVGDVDRPAHPHDPSDLGRCIRLLDTVPEWRACIGEMAALSPEWAALAGAWDELETLYRQEEPAGTAPRTYARMKKLLYPDRLQQPAAAAPPPPIPDPLLDKEIEDAINDSYALGRLDRTGKSLYQVKVELHALVDATVKVNVWAEHEEEAREKAEDWACDNASADDIDWDVDGGDVQIILNREDPDRLITDHEYAGARGQTFLVSRCPTAEAGGLKEQSG